MRKAHRALPPTTTIECVGVYRCECVTEQVGRVYDHPKGFTKDAFLYFSIRLVDGSLSLSLSIS
jgi:hypothetical protein